MRSIQYKLMVALLACTLLMLGGCFKGKGGNNGGNTGKGNWDSLMWDQDQWQ